LRNEPDLSTRSPIVTLSSLKYLTFQPMPYWMAASFPAEITRANKIIKSKQLLNWAMN
jgi:hypothetical protein